ncbi:MAG: hypothetical protein ACK4YP_06105 [Myxococcota bacterium]
MLLALLPLALAHRPHAVVRGFAPTPDFATSGVAWLVYDPSDNAQLLRTTDHGAHWDVVGGAPQGDALADMGWFGATTLVVLAEDGTVWTTDDQGASWASFPVPTGAPRGLSATAGRFAVATDDGVWAGTSLGVGSLVQGLAGTDVEEVAWTATGGPILLARHADGTLSRSIDGGASFVALPPLGGTAGATAIAEADGATWAGTTEGVSFYGAEGWAPCGPLPSTGAERNPNFVTELHATDTGVLYAMTATQAYFRSEDGCRSWTHVDAGLTATFGGIGGVVDMDDTYVGMVVAGAYEVVAGFDGVAYSADGGATWRRSSFVPADFVRGLAVSPGWPVDGRVLFGTYGGGAIWTADGGRTFGGSNDGLLGPYNFGLAVAEDFPTSNVAWWAGGEPDTPAITRDGGHTWEPLAIGLTYAVGASTLAGRAYLFGVADSADGGRLYRSDDGVAFTEMEGLYATLRGVFPSIVAEDVYDGRPRLLVATDRPAMLLASEDDGANWTVLGDWGAEDRSTGLEILGGRILLTTYDAGLHVSDDGGRTWTDTTEPVPHPRLFGQTDDGTLFVAGGDGQMWRSTDRGDTWSAAGEPLPPPPGVFAPAPDFATHGAAFVGTAAGVYWTADHGDSWHRLPRMQRFAAQGFHLTCAGPCAPYDDGSAGLMDAWDLTEVDVVSFAFPGTALRLVATPAMGAPLPVVTVDGVAVPVDAAREWLVDGLSPGWHDVEVRVIGGTLRLVAVEVLGEGEPFPLDGPDDTGADDTAPVDTATDDTATDTAPGETAADTPPLDIRADDGGGYDDGRGARLFAPRRLAARRRRPT